MAYKKKPVYKKGGSKKKKSVKKYPKGGSSGMYTGDYGKNSGMLDKEGSSMMTARYGLSTGKKKLGHGGTRRIGPMTEAEAMAANSMFTGQGPTAPLTGLAPSFTPEGTGGGRYGGIGKYPLKGMRMGGTSCSAKSKRRVKTRRDFK